MCMNVPYKVIIWGTGKKYSEYINLITLEEKKGNIVIVAVTSNDTYIQSSIDGYRFVNKNNLKELDFDYVVVTTVDINSVMSEIGNIHIPLDKIIPAFIFAIPRFDLHKYIRIKNEKLSILSVNCFAAVCYHSLGLPFRSPIINMYLSDRDFNKFVKHINYYLSQDVEYFKLGYSEALGREYPIGKIDDVYLHFNHYVNFKDAKAAWDRRKVRLNLKNLFIVSYSNDLEVIDEFCKLPNKNKKIFTNQKVIHDDVIYMGEYSQMPLWEQMLSVANGKNQMIDILALLNHESQYVRVQ